MSCKLHPRNARRFNIHRSINVIQHTNRHDRNHMIISIDTKKAFDEVQHTFIIKILIKMWTKGEYFNVGIMLLCTMERLSLCYSNADFSAFIACFNPDIAFVMSDSSLCKQFLSFIFCLVNKCWSSNGWVEERIGLKLPPARWEKEREREKGREGENKTWEGGSEKIPWEEISEEPDQ